eukprot:6178510-Pleurochrysis_carterae.AAC.4
MARLDARERELGFPSSYSALLNHQSPVRKPGFRGYFAGHRPVPAEVIQRYPHLTTEQAIALADAELTVKTLKSTHLNAPLRPRCAPGANTTKRALNADLATASPLSAPSFPPAPPAPAPPSSNDNAERHAPNDGGTVHHLFSRGSVLTMSLIVDAIVISLAVIVGLRFSDESGALASLPRVIPLYPYQSASTCRRTLLC